ncbi:PREDICTED: protein Hikeshi-like isoform X2 [Priapulus caudatus]|nr:PREDICTED: protein Hikeshi-like isoform X2 [Priapulus caudatus]XP_014676528.1 PREDICTED: protein Hikeshi-like isoform X2 [Priapulus caudatus]
MFAILVAGRLVQTECTQVSETQFLFDVQDADSVNHVAVFLTGLQPFPDTHGGAVYFSWPDPSGAARWQLLGHISNNKPSAIFKLSSLKKSGEDIANPFGAAPAHHLAQIGISVEPLDQLAAQVPAGGAAVSTSDTFTEFANKTLESLFNYASSFASTATPSAGEATLPLSVLQNWYMTFRRRLEQNPLFWRT